MSKTPESMRDRAFYEPYRQRMIDSGVPEDDATKAIDQELWEDACLDNGVCPTCEKRTLTRKIEGRQSGLSKMKGVWARYQCSCGYLMNRMDSPVEGSEVDACDA